MSSAIPSSDLLRAIVDAQATLSSVERQFAENEGQIAKMQEQLNKAQEKRGILTADLKSAKELVTRVSGELAAFYQPSVDAGYSSPADLPVSPQPPATPLKKRYTKEEKKAMSPEVKRAYNRAKKALAEERKAMRTPEEQAKIAERVAKMQEALKASRAAKKQASVDIGNRPALPARLVLEDADKRCHARRCIISTEDWFNKDSGLPSGGFKSKILLESQCPKDAKSQHLCTTCSEKKEKGWVKGKGDWHGLIGGSVPKESHVVGGEWAQKQYDTMWGVASPSGSDAEGAMATA